MKWLENIKNSDIQIARNGKKFIIVPAIIFLIGLILFFVPGMGFNLGLDFTGGSIITVDAANVTKDTIETKMDTYNVKYTVVAQEGVDGGDTFAITFNAGDKNTEILTELTAEFGEANIISSGSIQAKTSNEKVINVFWAVLAAWAGLMIYMLFRFKFTSGIATLLALVHDILIMSSLMIMFRVQINTSFIAALLTVLSYSINNSLVVFDKVRTSEKENVNKLPLHKILDNSIKHTLGRSILTAATTLMTILVLAIVSLFMNLPTLFEFTIPIIFGLLAGTYSSLFLISPMYLRFEGARIARKNKVNK